MTLKKFGSCAITEVNWTGKILPVFLSPGINYSSKSIICRTSKVHIYKVSV